MSFSTDSDCTAVVHFCNATSDITALPYSHQQCCALNDLLDLLVDRLSDAQFEDLRDRIAAARDQIKTWSSAGLVAKCRELEARHG